MVNERTILKRRFYKWIILLIIMNNSVKWVQSQPNWSVKNWAKKSNVWKKMKIKKKQYPDLNCLRCGHSWMPRIRSVEKNSKNPFVRPKVCPKVVLWVIKHLECKTYDFDKPYKRPPKNKRGGVKKWALLIFLSLKRLTWMRGSRCFKN